MIWQVFRDDCIVMRAGFEAFDGGEFLRSFDILRIALTDVAIDKNQICYKVPHACLTCVPKPEI